MPSFAFLCQHKHADLVLVKMYCLRFEDLAIVNCNFTTFAVGEGGGGGGGGGEG